MTLKFMRIDELLATPPADELPELLRYAAKCIEHGQLDSACWRLADASLLLRRRMVRRGYEDVPGLDVPTGRGAVMGGLEQ